MEDAAGPALLRVMAAVALAFVAFITCAAGPRRGAAG
jgi:hypothetical protein